MDSITLSHLSAWRHEPPRRKAVGRVLFIHGLSEHSARHLNTVDSLVGFGLEVVRFDLRGAGASGGKRQWVEHFEDYVEDAASVFHWICRELSNLPLFVLGHSLGGAIALHFVATYQRGLSGLVLSAPAFQVGTGISALKVAIGKVLSNMTPTLRIPQSSDPTGISRDPKVVEAFKNDPLCCHFNTVRQGNEILRALEEIPERAKQIVIPTLLFHGSADKIVRPLGSYEILRTLSSPDKILHILPGVYHEPHNDLDREQYFGLLQLWFQKHLSLKSKAAGLESSPSNRPLQSPLR